MTIEEYIASDAFFLFQDEALRQNACQAVEHWMS